MNHARIFFLPDFSTSFVINPFIPDKMDSSQDLVSVYLIRKFAGFVGCWDFYSGMEATEAFGLSRRRFSLRHWFSRFKTQNLSDTWSKIGRNLYPVIINAHPNSHKCAHFSPSLPRKVASTSGDLAWMRASAREKTLKVLILSCAQRFSQCFGCRAHGCSLGPSLSLK